MKADPKTTAGRAFVRTLNILLKLARLYGFDHARTAEHLEIAWRELRTAIPDGDDPGLLLGATGSQLLLDGVPLEGIPAEKQFAQLLSSAGLASVQFFPIITQEELGRFVRAFPTGKAKPAELAQQLKAALVGARGIRTNEICFVATDVRLRDASVAAQLAAASLGDDQDKVKEWLNDPQKLLELIAAAQGQEGGGPGAGSGSGGAGIGTGGGGADSGDSTGGAFGVGAGSGSEGTGIGTGGADSGDSAGGVFGVGAGPGPGTQGAGYVAGRGSGSGAGFGAGHGGGIGRASGSGGGFRGGSGPAVEPSEEEILGILSTLTSFGQMGVAGGGGVAAGPFQQQLSQLPGGAQATLRDALASLAAAAPEGKPDQSVLVRLAEHLAIRFALERYERGEVKVNAVRQLLERMNQEIENLRKILGAHESKMEAAGLDVESAADILDRQFWASVPESGKRAVLLSNEAWCIPPRNVRSYVAGLIERGDVAEAISILQNYAACAESDEADARKRTAVGLSDLAELYSKADGRLLGEALRHLGMRLSLERDAELQSLVSAAFVRLSQEAAVHRIFPVMEQALDLIAGVEAQRPGMAQNLRPKMGIEDRVPEFVEEALRAKEIAAGLSGVLKLLPRAAMEQLAVRFNRCSLREDAGHVAALAEEMGEEGLSYLRSTVRGGPVSDAVELVGLLCHLDSQAVEVYLPQRLSGFSPTAQDRIVRQIAASGAPGRCRLLLAALDHLDPLVMPLALDEVGMTADREALGRLLTIADGDLPAGGGPYLRVKAIEALGRIPAPESIKTLKKIVESRQMWRWVYPEELRIAALQSLEKLDPDWAREFRPKSGLEREDLALAPQDVSASCKFVRQRRHTRVRFPKPISAVSTNLRQNCRLQIKTASMTGGVAAIDRHLPPGTPVQLKLQVGLRHLQVTALLRDYRAQDMAFEFVDMDLEDRTRFRHLLAESFGAAKPSADSPESPAEPVLSR